MQQQSLTDSRVLLLSGKYCVSLNEKRREDACALQKSRNRGTKTEHTYHRFRTKCLRNAMRSRIAFHRLTRALVCHWRNSSCIAAMVYCWSYLAAAWGDCGITGADDHVPQDGSSLAEPCARDCD